MQTKHPKSENVLKVINTLEKVLPYAMKKNSLDFGSGRVHNKFKTMICGTSHCHAGWYALASGVKSAIGNLSFIDGIDRMAFDLDGIKPNTWANLNPDVWGNKNGILMFSASGQYSFISVTRPNGAETLKDIIDHWKEVYDRLIILEKKETVEISNPPITAEELIDQLSTKNIPKYANT